MSANPEDVMNLLVPDTSSNDDTGTTDDQTPDTTTDESTADIGDISTETDTDDSSSNEAEGDDHLDKALKDDADNSSKDDDKDDSSNKTELEKKPDETERQVPLHELLRERTNRQTQEKKNTELNDSITALRAEIEKLKNPPPPTPDAEEDPAGYLQHKTDELQGKIDTLENKNTENDKIARQNLQRENVQNHINQKQTEFESVTPDFKSAMEHMRKAQFTQLVNRGFSEQDAINGIFQHEFKEAASLMANGYNPAQLLYQKASQQFGYVKAAEAVATSDVDPNAATKEEFASKDAALQAASGNSGSGGNINLKKVLESPDEEFNKMWEGAFGAKNPY